MKTKILFFMIACTVTMQSQIILKKSINVSSTRLYEIMVAVSDINSDGKDEIISVSQEQNQQSKIMVSEMTGENISSTSFVIPYVGIRNFIPMEVSKDGKKDVVFIHGDSVSVCFQNALGQFLPENIVSLYSGKGVDGIAKGDFNHDGFEDIVCSHWNSPYLRIFFGSALGFTSNNTIDLPAVQSGYDQVKVFDVDGNGSDDIVFLAGQGVRSGMYVYLCKWNIPLDKMVPYCVAMTTPERRLNPTNVVFGNFFGFGKSLMVHEQWSGMTKAVSSNTGNEDLLTVDVKSYGCFTPSALAFDINKDGSDEAIYITTNQELAMYDFKTDVRQTLSSVSAYGNNHVFNQLLAIGDVDNDGYPEVVQASDNGIISIFKVSVATTGVEKTGISKPFKISTKSGMLKVSLDEPGVINVCNLHGQILYSQANIQQFEKEFNAGIYIISINNQAQKIIIS
ncbi:MAG: VCBS repeat-containing protein [Candidatus Absconditabacteria bacterium]